MNYKVENLTKKIFRNFITGKYGPPMIPTESDVILKLESITSSDYDPITKDKAMKDIDIRHIKTTFNTIIDDIDILYDSIESESTYSILIIKQSDKINSNFFSNSITVNVTNSSIFTNANAINLSLTSMSGDSLGIYRRSIQTIIHDV